MVASERGGGVASKHLTFQPHDPQTGGMARPLRLEFEDAIYHLFGRGNARQRIFASEQDQLKFVKLVEASARRFDVAILAFVLMERSLRVSL